MSFFGLTAFGPESLVKSTLVNSGCFNLYFDDDYKRGYTEVQKKHGQVKLKDMAELMTYTMGFPPLEEEVATFVQFSGKQNPEDSLSFEELVNTLNVIREKLNETAKLSCQFSSYNHLSLMNEMHKAKEVDPNVYFKSPACAGMNYGFYHFQDRDLNKEKFPKRKCDETKYQEKYIMSGFGQ